MYKTVCVTDRVFRRCTSVFFGSHSCPSLLYVVFVSILRNSTILIIYVRHFSIQMIQVY